MASLARLNCDRYTTHNLSWENDLFITMLTQFGFYLPSYCAISSWGLSDRGCLCDAQLYCSPWLYLILSTAFSFFWHFSCHLSTPCFILAVPSPITLSPRCECIYYVEQVHFMLITPSPISVATVTEPCVYLALHARREHTGCHRANICQGDLVCQSWRMAA